MDDINKLRELADRFFRPLVCTADGRHTDWRCDIISLRGFAIALAAEPTQQEADLVCDGSRGALCIHQDPNNCRRERDCPAFAPTQQEDAIRAAVLEERERWIARVKEAFRDGFYSPRTYKDMTLNTVDDAWEEAKAALLTPPAIRKEPT